MTTFLWILLVLVALFGGTFCDQTFDNIHIFSFDYQGQAFESLENFAIDG